MCTLLVLLTSNPAPAEKPDSESIDSRLAAAEARIRGIYERGEFRAKRFRAEWLPDSSGYTTMESVPGTKERVPVRYDAASGKRTEMKSGDRGGDARSGNVSPDGHRKFYFQNGDLHVRDLDSDQTTALTRERARPIAVDQQSELEPRWEADRPSCSRIPRRSGSDSSWSRPIPSYPELREDRFARVGETIPSLRVGVVDCKAAETRWLSLPEPAEGFYLGQVSWTGNDEVLVEKLSRFRNERQFLLANVHTGRDKNDLPGIGPGVGRRQHREERRVGVDPRWPGVRRGQRGRTDGGTPMSAPATARKKRF